MSLFGKLEGHLDIESGADKFHDVFSNRPHHVPNITPNHIQSCDLHDGEYGSSGSIVYWNYVHDGKASVVKELIEAINDENNSTTYKVLEGDLLELFKEMRFTVKATAKKNGGSVVTWIMEYQKLHADIPDPHTLMEFLFNVTREIDAHHLQDQA